MRTLIRDQYLTYNGIKLVSVYSDDFPYNRERCKSLWYIPGREIMGTDAIINMANARKVPLTLTVFSEGIGSTTRLI